MYYAVGVVVLTSTQCSRGPTCQSICYLPTTAWNVLVPGILVAGGAAGGWSIAGLRPCLAIVLSYFWASQEMVTVVYMDILHLFGGGYGRTVACVELG